MVSSYQHLPQTEELEFVAKMRDKIIEMDPRNSNKNILNVNTELRRETGQIDRVTEILESTVNSNSQTIQSSSV